MAENLKLDINYKAIDPIDQNISSIRQIIIKLIKASDKILKTAWWGGSHVHTEN